MFLNTSSGDLPSTLISQLRENAASSFRLLKDTDRTVNDDNIRLTVKYGGPLIFGHEEDKRA